MKQKERKTIGYFLAAAALAGTAVGVMGIWKSRMKNLQVQKMTLEIKGLSQAFHGLNILHVTDLHAKRSNLAVWEKILKQDADLAVFTGDFTTANPIDLLDHLPFCRQLREKMPVYFVFGNHERYVKSEIATMLRYQGWQILDMDMAYFEKYGRKLPIIGVSDWYELKQKNFSDLPPLLEKAAGIADDFYLLLSHQPQIIDEVSQENTLILSGHTHGGQIRLPGFPVLYAPGQGLFPKYGYGLFKKNKSTLYISSGIGTTHFPLRLFNPPEISVITLEKN